MLQNFPPKISKPTKPYFLADSIFRQQIPQPKAASSEPDDVRTRLLAPGAKVIRAYLSARLQRIPHQRARVHHDANMMDTRVRCAAAAVASTTEEDGVARLALGIGDFPVSQFALRRAVHRRRHAKSFVEEVPTRHLANCPAKQARAVEAATCGTAAGSTPVQVVNPLRLPRFG